ncbi:diacylglycerol/lipid kinase family protein [Muricoccus radiodurans]|uniref:diacylglycerol/lipid kinase family protein n=1 Tax=Muricoccus radiodurans TaxID=2231721 RepID=UPI003CF3C673
MQPSGEPAVPLPPVTPDPADAPRPPTRAVLVMNTRARTLLGRPELAGEVVAALAQAGFLLSVVDDPTMSFPERIEAAIADPAELLICGGGDGTIRTLAARLAGTGRVLGVLPLGTLNLVARDLGLPLDPVEAALALGTAAPRRIDVAEVNGQVFLCQSVIGVPNAIGRHRERHRGKGFFRALVRVAVAAARALWRRRALRLAVTSPGWRRPWRVWTRALSVVSNDYEEAPGRFFSRPKLDGGVLTLYVSRRFSVIWSLKMLARMAIGSWKRSPDIAMISATAFTILSQRRRLRVMNDGEAAVLMTPLRYTIRPGALTVLAPMREAVPA